MTRLPTLPVLTGTYDATTDTYTPQGRGSDCGFACHTIMKAKDYVFTAYGKR